ncbi:protein-arginine deiminase (PAD) domain-containing protein [Hirsutella rhossiliensis]|uniref:Protein-arginine deiminase (PAD) domain-containing protein n=1 Tax=Hirsutella rhossiliensis TaxID=111463 RepID=A0A9P8MTP6_9HYPO|nr:protein-arginine deiminase (PAD) domain-containing protein [Hirsutella rhossiliensis]KAH0961050.1 protein-arginine deiminase (PAD) domain-containing protein [Hirsutella rhossiliensis]
MKRLFRLVSGIFAVTTASASSRVIRDSCQTSQCYLGIDQLLNGRTHAFCQDIILNDQHYYQLLTQEESGKLGQYCDYLQDAVKSACQCVIPNPTNTITPQSTGSTPAGETSGTIKDLSVTILADTNRDGKVDVTGETDFAGKEIWTPESGALFMANIGDTDGRCSHLFKPENCNDASDNVLRNSTYLAPLLTVPNPKLSNSATGFITVLNETAAPKVRIFYRRSNKWVYVASDYIFTAEELKIGLELGIDARDIRRPRGWDGRATVEFRVKDGNQEAKDSVALRVAPILTHNHGQLAEQLLTTLLPEHFHWKRPDMVQFVEELKNVSNRAGMKKPLHAFDTDDIWTQDFFEPGYTSIPGPGGPIGLRVMIRSSQESRAAGLKIFGDLRSSTAGAVQDFSGVGHPRDDFESTGNLETIPPYTYNGKSYPAGRAVMGSPEGKKLHMMAFLEAQEVQEPLRIDTSWLGVGHIDEFMQFLPVESERGWVMAVDDPLTALKMLKKAQQDGQGGVKAVSRPRFPTDPTKACYPADTIDQVINKTDFTSVQENSAKEIQRNIDIIKRETGITDREIVRIPALYYYAGKSRPHWNCELAEGRNGNERRDLDAESASGQSSRNSSLAPPEQLEAQVANIFGEMTEIPVLRAGTPPKPVERRKVAKEDRVTSFYPSTINSIVLNNKEVLAPNPWGPVIGGKDILGAAVSAAYAGVNYTVSYMDDWFTHHVIFGDIHCGSNVIRDMSHKWW